MSEEFVDAAPPTSFDPLRPPPTPFSSSRSSLPSHETVAYDFSTRSRNFPRYRTRRSTLKSEKLDAYLFRIWFDYILIGEKTTRLFGLNSDELFDVEIKICTYLVRLRRWIEIICSNSKETKIFSRWVRAENEYTYEKVDKGTTIESRKMQAERRLLGIYVDGQDRSSSKANKFAPTSRCY